jgi:activator of 2-hydroxyglutaryl-CoA dehydratase
VLPGSEADILAGAARGHHPAGDTLLRRASIADKFAITGGISKNVGMVAKIEERLGGRKVHLTAEPQIAGAVAATLFALDRARKKAPQGDGRVSAGGMTWRRAMRRWVP